MASIMYCLLSVLLLASQLYGIEAESQVHIVYLGSVNEMAKTNCHENLHMGMLSHALGSEQGAAESILYSYKSGFNGFAAVMSDDHAETMRGMDGVVSVFKSQTLQLHTTSSWEQSLGLSSTDPNGLWAETEFGNGTIIGMIDTGIWPESKSFSDDGFGPIPSRWNGSCVTGEQFDRVKNCNKKLIGAKFYYKGYEALANITAPDYKSPRDQNGHGTHTSSTAGGNRVANASFDGLANGTATGGAPSARIAMYKVCWKNGCTDADILAALDDAVADGVDIISMSLGRFATDYQLDSVAIGAFHAVEKGILVACSAGNDGPAGDTATNIAPWIFTVGANSINREYQTSVRYGSNNTLDTVATGTSLNTFEKGNPTRIVYGGNIPANNLSDSTACYNGSIDPAKVKGNYIVCRGSYSGIDETLIYYGAKGLVSISDIDTVQFNWGLPIAFVDTAQGDDLFKFINNTENAIAVIEKTVTYFNSSAEPTMGYFSSVGPNIITEDILKPDITAPGVDILASWAPVDTPSENPHDPRSTDFNIISGTSMACPHAAGLAALIKSRHPDWSPAAIKSAIMTTATPLNKAIPGNFELASGAGQINPTRAADPGLVFDLTTDDYISFMCAIGYNSTVVRSVSQGNQTCPQKNTTVLDMNYPSIYMSSSTTVGAVHNITRTVTNVGPSLNPVTYTATVNPVNHTDIQVIPSSLNFTAINEQQSFSVIAKITSNITFYYFGSITWSDGFHSVRMPIGVGPSAPFGVDGGA